MKYSQLAAFLTVLVANFGEIGPNEWTDLQEDCAGVGVLATAAQHFGLKASKRDVAWMYLLYCWSFSDFKLKWLSNNYCFVWLGPCSCEVKYNPAYDLLSAIGFMIILQGVPRPFNWFHFKEIRCGKLLKEISSVKCFWFLAHGFQMFLLQVRSLCPGSIWWCGPPCATWVWLSRGSTGRSCTRVRGGG